MVSRERLGEGLALFWKSDIDVMITNFSHHHIDKVVNAGSLDEWRFTGFYVAPEQHIRYESWNLLRSLHRQSTVPWCCAGDFNEIVRMEEKQGRSPRAKSQMQAFRDVLDECGFVDLGYTGAPFTWCKNRDDWNTVWERLDRAVATTTWLELFPLAKVHHLDEFESDHKLVWIQLVGLDNTRLRRELFRFEEMWTQDQGCEETIDSAWQQQQPSSRMSQFKHKMKSCRHRL